MLLDGIVDSKVLRVMKLFLEHPDEFYHINKVAEEAGVPLATTFRIIKKLHVNRILESNSISKFKIYRLRKCAKTKTLRRLL